MEARLTEEVRALREAKLVDKVNKRPGVARAVLQTS